MSPNKQSRLGHRHNTMSHTTGIWMEMQLQHCQYNYKFMAHNLHLKEVKLSPTNDCFSCCSCPCPCCQWAMQPGRHNFVTPAAVVVAAWLASAKFFHYSKPKVVVLSLFNTFSFLSVRLIHHQLIVAPITISTFHILSALDWAIWYGWETILGNTYYLLMMPYNYYRLLPTLSLIKWSPGRARQATRSWFIHTLYFCSG